LSRLPIHRKLTTNNQGGDNLDPQAPENRIRLLLLDDEALLRASLARLLAAEPDLQVVAECGTPSQALEILGVSAVDVVLVDFAHAVEAGGALISAANRQRLPSRFLVVADMADARVSALVIRLGASGIFLKSEAPHRLVLAIKVVASGGVWLDPHVAELADLRHSAGC
jgi:DNA-binding NarL/FixJ family response regulator